MSSRRGVRERLLDIDLDGRRVPLRLRRNARARRLILRVDPGGSGAVVTLPASASWAAALDLVDRERDWLGRALAAMPERVAFVPGNGVPVLGQEHVIEHRPGRGRPVTAADGVLGVTGDPAHLPRRVRDWLRDRARQVIAPMTHDKAGRVERAIQRITIRETRSRWGSCAAGGRLSFCWRLVMAPPPAVDYVVAHEVAHLVHHDHGPAFWRLAASLTDHMEEGRAWLRTHGPGLHRYG